MFFFSFLFFKYKIVSKVLVLRLWTGFANNPDLNPLENVWHNGFLNFLKECLLLWFYYTKVLIAFRIIKSVKNTLRVDFFNG